MKIQIDKDKLALLPPGELTPNPKNRNKHSDEQIDRLCELIKYQGFRQPIIVSKRSGLIVVGHGRLEAAKKLKLPHVPVLFQDFDSEEQEYAFCVSDNAIALWAELDLSGINSDLPDLGPDFDIDLLGIKDFVLEPVEKLDQQCDEDEVPDALPEPKVVRGEVYILGKHRLMCGDSTAITDVELLTKGEKPHFVFTDPPYELNAEALCSTFSSFDHTVLICTFKQAAEIYKTECFNFRFDFVINAHVPKSFMNHKQPYYVHQTGVYFTSLNADTIFDCLNAKGTRSENAYWSTIIDAPRNTSEKHGHSKNVKGLVDVICGFTGNKVIDLFGGSGSTLIACEKINRHCFMMELDPHYCGVILDRWQKFTGKKAHREDGVLWDEIKDMNNA